jgi:TetR/AcrR family transcriptional repressor of nem operon
MKKRKGEITRERIVAQTAQLLNREGYLRTPVSEIMRVTGMQKGGIYNHFESREQLTLEAFDFAFARMRDYLIASIAGKRSANDKLCALVEAFRCGSEQEAMRGGCPIGNMAIEADDADPRLRAAARQSMGRLIGLFERIVAEGIEGGEFAKGDARARATQLVASLEGALLISNLYKDPSYIAGVASRLKDEIRAGFR